MGKQVNFFMLGRDEEQFATRIRECGGCIIPLRSVGPAIATLAELPEPPERCGELCIAPPGRLSDVRSQYYPGVKQYIVDEAASPVIQFHRCRRTDTALYGGRIWAEMRYPVRVPEGIVLGESKGEDLERLYQCLAGWMRRTFRRDPVFGFYAGEEALRFHAEGGELRQ